MADREVTHTGKKTVRQSFEVITSLGNPGQPWSPRQKEDAISDIESGRHGYHVAGPDRSTRVEVVEGVTGKYLRTDWDDTERNNLLDLPDC